MFDRLIRLAFAAVTAILCLGCRRAPDHDANSRKTSRQPIELGGGSHAKRATTATLDGGQTVPAPSPPSADTVRPLSPQPGSVITSDRVLFRWHATGEARVQLARDRSFGTIRRFASGRGEAEIDKLEGGWWFWRVVSAEGRESHIWPLRVIPSSSRLVRQGVLQGVNVNGDAFDDLVFDQSVYLGRTRPSPEYDWDTTESPVLVATPVGTPCTVDQSTNPVYGRRCQEIPPESYLLGDINGDGYDDFAKNYYSREPHVETTDHSPRREHHHALLYFGNEKLGRPWRGVMTCVGAGESKWGRSEVEPAVRLEDRSEECLPLDMATRLGDINGDGYADVAVAVRQFVQKDGVSQLVRGGATQVYLGGPKGLSDRPVATLKAPLMHFFGGGDLDGDGYCDLIAIDRSEVLWIYTGTPTGLPVAPTHSIKLPTLPSSATSSKQVRVADVDRDGLCDILGVNDQAGVWLIRGRSDARQMEIDRHRLSYQALRPSPGATLLEGMFVEALVASDQPTTAIAVVHGEKLNKNSWVLDLVDYQEGRGFSWAHRSVVHWYSLYHSMSVGDVNGDHLDDLLIVGTDDLDSTFNSVLFPGTQKGIRLDRGVVNLWTEYHDKQVPDFFVLTEEERLGRTKAENGG